MSANLVGLAFGVAFGFVMACARLSDPAVIRRMLLLREPDVFLLMGSAVVVAAIGVRLLRALQTRALVTGEAIAWTVQAPRLGHVTGSAIFGAGWSVAATCPGPLAVMVGEGRIMAVAVVAGIIGGITAWGALERRKRAVADSSATEAALVL